MSETRYWQHNETGRLLKADVQMAPSNWTEITKEEYEIFQSILNAQTGRVKC